MRTLTITLLLFFSAMTGCVEADSPPVEEPVDLVAEQELMQQLQRGPNQVKALETDQGLKGFASMRKGK
ncbi:MAG: hypothetical protein R3C01_05925 [Planctomycetaceae bacterium]